MVGASARVSGTPTEAGTFTFTVTATDTQSATGSQSYTVRIVARRRHPPSSVAPPSLPNGVVGTVVLADDLGQRRHRAVHIWASTGTLPAGLSLNAATGVLSGTPTTAGISNFTITATDTTNATGSHAYALTITATPTPPITLSPTTLPDGTVGAAYAQTVTALGGNGGPYTLAVSAGSLPLGLTFTGGLLRSGRQPRQAHSRSRSRRPIRRTTPAARPIPSRSAGPRRRRRRSPSRRRPCPTGRSASPMQRGYLPPQAACLRTRDR